MSTSFAVEPDTSDLLGWVIARWSESAGEFIADPAFPRFEHFEAAEAAWLEAGLLSSDDATLRPVSALDGCPTVTLSSRNTRQLFARLGVPFSQHGEIAPADLAAACDTADTADEQPGSGPGRGARGAMYFEHGQRAGYFAEVITELIGVAFAAAVAGRNVVWS